ncbi:MAG: methionyl-tRNA formyltransferase [Rickettsiales bacterium]|nr:methionyl-tRNA formyltransferase [Rickettsiales bacterium]
MKIIFMGTPQFACPALEELIALTKKNPDFEIVAVYTRQPQIAGRGHKLQNSPIHDLALKNNLKVITPKTLKNWQTQKEFSDFDADVAVVVAYGLILPQEILDNVKKGCINIHPSLLPRWRGASPIQRPILEGDKETGITIIKMNKDLDSGDIICQEKFALTGKETYKDLALKLAEMGAKILIKTLENLRYDNIVLTKQDDSLATYAKKIEKSECEIDWTKSAQEIEQKIRGLNGSLEAHFILNGEKIKIFAAEIIDQNSCNNKAGEILDDRLTIQCGKGLIRPKILQRAGKNQMLLSEFLRGFKIEKSLS